MNSNPIEEGLRLTIEKRVEAKDLAINMGTSNVNALSTSELILTIEKAVTTLVAPYLEENCDTVTSEINIKHFKPATEGDLIKCMVHLKYIEKNKLFFDVVVLDETLEEIAIGAHSRYIIQTKAFESYFNKSNKQ